MSYVVSESISINNSSYFSNASSSAVFDKFESGFEPWADYLYGFFMIFVGITSIVGNSLAVHVFRRKGRNITVPEVLLLNIALSDLFLAGASHPATIIAAFSHRWIFGELGCSLYGAVCYFLGIATIFTLTALAVVRLLKTCFPDKGRWLTTKRTWSCLILPIYLYSLAWTVIPFFGWSGYDVERFGLSCTLAWEDPHYSSKVYIVAVTIGCFVLPAIAITGSHVGILLQIRKAGQMFSDKTAGKQSNQAESQFVRVSFGVCFGFLFAWFPYSIISFWAAFGDASSIPMWITPIPVLLAKSAIAYNPVIYVMMTRRYRVDFNKAFRELLHLSGPRDEVSILTPPLRRTLYTEQESFGKMVGSMLETNSCRRATHDEIISYRCGHIKSEEIEMGEICRGVPDDANTSPASHLCINC